MCPRISMPSSVRQDSSTEEQSESTDHQLVRVKERVPGREPSDYDVDLSSNPSNTYSTTYWRCRYCGQERNHKDEFSQSCPVGALTDPVTDGGYSIEDDRTRRALTEDMDVRYFPIGVSSGAKAVT